MSYIVTYSRVVDSETGKTVATYKVTSDGAVVSRPDGSVIGTVEDTAQDILFLLHSTGH